jgi:hypothetical protein
MTTLAEDLQARFGPGAIVDVSPFYVDDRSDDFRWVVRIDGKTIPELDVVTRPTEGSSSGHIDIVVVDDTGREMVAFHGFPTTGASVLRTLLELS